MRLRGQQNTYDSAGRHQGGSFNSMRMIWTEEYYLVLQQLPIYNRLGPVSSAAEEQWILIRKKAA